MVKRPRRNSNLPVARYDGAASAALGHTFQAVPNQLGAPANPTSAARPTILMYPGRDTEL
jgi:hypothetical protein